MSESVEYIPIADGFRKSFEVLKKDGYLLAADMFKKEDAPEIISKSRVGPHLIDKYMDCASGSGFRIVKEECISTNVLPTVVFW
jgi:hypothetical protein